MKLRKSNSKTEGPSTTTMKRNDTMTGARAAAQTDPKDSDLVESSSKVGDAVEKRPENRVDKGPSGLGLGAYSSDED